MFYFRPRLEEKNKINIESDAESAKSEVFKKHGAYKVFISYISLFFMSINLNNAKMITYLKRNGLLNLEPEKLEHLPGHEEHYFRNLEYNAYQLQDYKNLQNRFLNMPLKKSSTNFSLFKELMVQRLLENFLKSDQYDVFMKTRNLVSKTKYPGSVREFRFFFGLYKNSGMTSRAFDLIASTTWAEKVEDELLRSRFYLETRYAYFSRHKRNPLLVYNFFRHGVFPVHFWSMFYSKMKRTRTLGRKVDRAVQIASGYPELGRQLNHVHYPSRVRKQDIPLKLTPELKKQQLLLKKHGIFTEKKKAFHTKAATTYSNFSQILRLISVDVPVVFSFLTNLNYLVLVLFGELFGDFLFKQVHYASNLYNIRNQIEQNMLFNSKIRGWSKMFSFIFFDFWFKCLRSLYVFFYFARFKLFNTNFIWYLLSNFLQILVFFLQALKINDRSALAFLYTFFYKDFFKFKLKGKKAHRLLKNWGVLGIVLEIIIFLFSFIFLILMDLCRLFIKSLLKFKFYAYSYIYIKFFTLNFIKKILINIINPFYYVMLYCEDFDLDTRRFEKQDNLNVYGKGPQVFEPIEIFFVGFIFWKTLLKKYWWDVVIEHEVGLKRWPFFYKLSKEFIWFDSFLNFLYDFKCFLILIYYKTIFVIFFWFKQWIYLWFKMFRFSLLYVYSSLFFFIIVVLGNIFSFLASIKELIVKKIGFKSLEQPKCNNFLTLASIYKWFLKDRTRKSIRIALLRKKPTSKFIFEYENNEYNIRQDDFWFFTKIKKLYTSFEKKRISFFDNFCKSNKTVYQQKISTLDPYNQLQRKSAVNSLHAVYGYMKDDSNVSEKSETNSLKIRQIFWSNGISRISHIIVENILWSSESDHKIYNKYSSRSYLNCNSTPKIFPIDLFLKTIDPGHNLILQSRLKTLKLFSTDIKRIKSSSNFTFLDKYFFSFFCTSWLNKVQNARDYFQILDFDRNTRMLFEDRYRDIEDFLWKSHEIRLNNLKEFFEQQQNIKGTNRFVSFFKTQMSKSGLYSFKMQDECSDFVTFYHRFAQFDFSSYVLKLKNVRSVSRLSWFFYGSTFLGTSGGYVFSYFNSPYKNVSRKTPLSQNRLDHWTIPLDVLKSLFFRAWFFIFQRIEPYIWKRYNTTTSKRKKLVETVVFKLNIDRKFISSYYWNIKKNKFRTWFLKPSKNEQWSSGVMFLKESLKLPKEKSIFESLLFQFFLRKILLLYVVILYYFVIILKHQPAFLKPKLSKMFYLWMQLAVWGSAKTKCLFHFWSFLSKETLSFYTGFFYVRLFNNQLDVHEQWFKFLSGIFSFTLYRYYEESLEDGSFLRGVPAEEYKWRGDIVYSFDIYRRIVDEFLDVVIRTRVSAVKLKQKGELISDKELFWRNFLKQEKGLLSREDRPDSYVASAFQVQGNIIARSRAYAIYRSLLMATNLRFYYQKIILGYDDEDRVNIFLEEYPEFRDLFVDDKDLNKWRKRYKSKHEINAAKKRREYYYDNAFLNLLPDVWFVARRFMKFKLWKDHFLLKFWLWFSATSNFKTNFYFFFIFIVIIGFGFFSLFTLKGWVTISSVISSYVIFLTSSLLWFFESIFFNLLGFSWAMFREIFESFFYNVVLYPDLQSTLLSLGLYDVFLFFMNNFVLYEADAFVKERIILIFITTLWVFINSIFFNLLTLPLLLISVMFNDMYILSFFSFFTSIDFSWIVYVFKKQLVVLVYKYILFITYFIYKFIPTVFWHMFFLFEYGWDYLLVWIITIKSSYIDVGPLFWNVISPLSWKYFPTTTLNIAFIAYNWEEILYEMMWDIIWQLGLIFYFIDLVIYTSMDIWDLTKYFICEPLCLLVTEASTPMWDKKLVKLLYPIYAIYTFINPFFIFITHGFMLICVEILIKILDLFIFIDFGLKFLVEFFFEDVTLNDLIVFFLHSLVWLYSNIIYYSILMPFMYLIFGVLYLVKFLCILPFEVFLILEFFFANLYTGLLIVLKIFMSIFEGCFDFLLLINKLLATLFVNNGLMFLYQMLLQFLNYLLIIVLFPIKLFSFVLIKILHVCSPLFLINICFNKLLVFLNEFGLLFYIFFKEILMLFLLILKTLFGFISNFFLSLIAFFWLFVEVLDAFFPSLKYIFNPVGGISVFYATFYYYFFIFICYVWSLSFRAFNDTTREPPLPSEVWPEIVEELEDHPVIQHLPFDVYQLLYSEKLSTRKGLPPKLDQSLRSWLPSKPQPNLAKLTQVKTTPLNVQGFYYMFLNGLTRKAISAYYKNKKQISLKTREKFFRSLGIKEFFHFLRDLPLDILDATAEFLRFEWKTEKPIFERDAKTPLGERLNLPIIMQSFELIFPKDVQHRRRRDAQIFEQLLTERFGSGQADEIIWSFPILGRIFNIRNPKEQQEYFKIEVLKAGWKHGFDAKLTPAQREIKKKMILHWIVKSRDTGFVLESFQTDKWKKGQAALRYPLTEEMESLIEQNIHDFENEMGGSDLRGFSEKFKESETLRQLTKQIERDLDKFHIKRYEKIAVITDRDGETIADPLFLAVRALDLFLYPVLVFATVNTGWWYSSNGMMDATMRYVELEHYASEMAEVFENDMDMDALFSDKEAFIHKIGSEAVSNMVLFNSKEAVDLFFPTQQAVNWFWDKFVKEHPELNMDFSLFMEQDPYYFLEAASSYIADTIETDTLGKKDPWADYIYKFWKNKKETLPYKLGEPAMETLSVNLESILDSIGDIKFNTLNENKTFNNISKDFKLKGVDKKYNFKEKWKEFLQASDQEGVDKSMEFFEQEKLNFLAKIFNEEFLGYTLYVSSDFDIKRYEMSGAYFFSDWLNKSEVIDYEKVEEDDITKLKRLYDKVTEDEAKEQLARNVAALKKLADDEGLETETQEGRRFLLQYALDHNLVKFEIEDEDQRKFAKILQEGGGDQFTDEELEELHEKAKERFNSVFIEVFSAFDGPQREQEAALQKQRLEKRDEKLKWFYDQLKRFKPAEHPLNEKQAIEDLMFVYHNFQRDPGFWFWSNPLLYKGLLPFYKTYFDQLDRRSLFHKKADVGVSTLLMKPYKDFIDYYFLEDYLKPTTQIYPKLLQSIEQTPITIARTQPYPYGFQFIDTIEHRYNVTRPYGHIQEYLDLLRESEISVYEAKGMDPRFTAKFVVDVEQFKEEVLFGEVFYKYYTSGFLSLFENDTLKWLLWGFYKIYEGTILGDFIHKAFMGLFANSLMFGPSVLPVMIEDLDPETKMVLYDRFGHGDLTPFKWDFYNPYTGFTFYNHNEQVLNKRRALIYFDKPEEFSDHWFLQNISTNPFIAANVLTEHMKHASYEKSSIFHTSEMSIQLTSFFRRYLSEEIKLFIRFGLYIWMYATEFVDILGDYFSTYALLRSLYDLVITPVVMFYNISKSIYFLLNEMGLRLYQIYAYLTINLRIFETFSYVFNLFVIQPLTGFSSFCVQVLNWGLNQIWLSLYTDLLINMGFDTWWKRTLIRHLFLSIGPSLEFIHYSYFLNPVKFVLFFKKRFWEYTSAIWNFQNMYDIWKLPHAFFKGPDRYLQIMWLKGVVWVGVGVKHYSEFRYTILQYSFLWLMLDRWLKFNTTPLAFSFYNLSDWDYSSWQILWQITSPHWFFTKLHIQAPFAVNHFFMILFDKLDTFFPVYSNLEIILEQLTLNAYHTGTDTKTLTEWQPYSFEDSYSQWALVLSIAELQGLDNIYKDYFGYLNYGDYEMRETNKAFVKLRSAEGMPFLLRESVEAPYSLAISDALIVLSKTEQQYLSKRAVNKVFSKEHYFAFDFLKEYNEGFAKSDTAFKLTMRQWFSDFRFWNAYGFIKSPSDISLRPAFTYDVSSNFYSNMRLYEEELGIRKLRYFFHRYQWLIQDVFPYRNDMTKLSDLFVEMVFERGIFDVMHMRFSNTKQTVTDLETPLQQTPILRISVDVYGNFVYCLEGPDWFINPEPSEMDVFINDLLDPVLDDFAGFMINKAYPSVKTSLWFVFDKLATLENKLFPGPRPAGQPSKEMIEILVHLEEQHSGVINPEYVESLYYGGTAYRVKDYLGEDYKSPGLIRQEREEWKKQQAEERKMFKKVEKQKYEELASMASSMDDIDFTFNYEFDSSPTETSSTSMSSVNVNNEEEEEKK